MDLRKYFWGGGGESIFFHNGVHYESVPLCIRDSRALIALVYLGSPNHMDTGHLQYSSVIRALLL